MTETFSGTNGTRGRVELDTSRFADARKEVVDNARQIDGALQETAKVVDRLQRSLLEIGGPGAKASATIQNLTAASAGLKRAIAIDDVTRQFADLAKETKETSSVLTELQKSMRDVGAESEEIDKATAAFKRMVAEKDKAQGGGKFNLAEGLDFFGRVGGRSLAGIGATGPANIVRGVGDVGELAGLIQFMGKSAKEAGKNLGAIVESALPLGPLVIAVAGLSAALQIINDEFAKGKAAVEGFIKAQNSELDLRLQTNQAIQSTSSEAAAARVRDLAQQKVLIDSELAARRTQRDQIAQMYTSLGSAIDPLTRAALGQTGQQLDEALKGLIERQEQLQREYQNTDAVLLPAIELRERETKAIQEYITQIQLQLQLDKEARQLADSRDPKAIKAQIGNQQGDLDDANAAIFANARKVLQQLNQEATSPGQREQIERARVNLSKAEADPARGQSDAFKQFRSNIDALLISMGKKPNDVLLINELDQLREKAGQTAQSLAVLTRALPGAQQRAAEDEATGKAIQAIQFESAAKVQAAELAKRLSGTEIQNLIKSQQLQIDQNNGLIDSYKKLDPTNEAVKKEIDALTVANLKLRASMKAEDAVIAAATWQDFLGKLGKGAKQVFDGGVKAVTDGFSKLGETFADVNAKTTQFAAENRKIQAERLLAATRAEEDFSRQRAQALADQAKGLARQDADHYQSRQGKIDQFYGSLGESDAAANEARRKLEEDFNQESIKRANDLAAQIAQIELDTRRSNLEAAARIDARAIIQNNNAMAAKIQDLSRTYNAEKGERDREHAIRMADDEKQHEGERALQIAHFEAQLQQEDEQYNLQRERQIDDFNERIGREDQQRAIAAARRDQDYARQDAERISHQNQEIGNLVAHHLNLRNLTTVNAGQIETTWSTMLGNLKTSASSILGGLFPGGIGPQQPAPQPAYVPPQQPTYSAPVYPVAPVGRTAVTTSAISTSRTYTRAIAQYDSGTNRVPQTGLYELHSEEVVADRPTSREIRRVLGNDFSMTDLASAVSGNSGGSFHWSGNVVFPGGAGDYSKNDLQRMMNQAAGEAFDQRFKMATEKGRR